MQEDSLCTHLHVTIPSLSTHTPPFRHRLGWQELTARAFPGLGTSVLISMSLIGPSSVSSSLGGIGLTGTSVLIRWVRSVKSENIYRMGEFSGTGASYHWSRQWWWGRCSWESSSCADAYERWRCSSRIQALGNSCRWGPMLLLKCLLVCSNKVGHLKTITQVSCWVADSFSFTTYTRY